MKLHTLASSLKRLWWTLLESALALLIVCVSLVYLLGVLTYLKLLELKVNT